MVAFTVLDVIVVARTGHLLVTGTNRFRALPGLWAKMIVMENKMVDGEDQEQDVAQPEKRGGSRSGIAAALGRAPLGGGLAHWGGPRPARECAVPVDVAGVPRPGRLPSTG